MSNIQIVSKERHKDKTWSTPSNHSFAKNDILCSLVAQELPHIVMTLPTGFTSSDDGFMPVALLGLETDKNLVVDESGYWRSHYIPDVYKCYPFSPALVEGELILCIDEDGGQINGESGQPFFTESGDITPTISKVLEFYVENLDYKKQTELACSLLEKFKLIEPWPIHIEIRGEKRHIDGLYRISESNLNELTGNELEELRNGGGLIVAYCQLLSMAHLDKLVTLTQAPESMETKELDLDKISDLGSLDFSNL